MNKKNIKKIISVVLATVLTVPMLLLTGCGSSSGDKLGFQMDAPQVGEEIAVINTSMGTIKMRLFPDQAPKAVENFTTLAEEGYYNGIIFHRVIEGFCVQGGDPTGTGTGGQSIYGKGFENETCAELVNLTGAVAMANAGPGTNGSQFYINQGGTEKFIGWNYLMSQMDSSVVTDEYKELYTTYGGNPTLDEYYNKTKVGYTVFGQVFEGMDVVNAIAAVPVDSNDKPVSDVTIQSIDIVPYEG